jgi:hypothetical protein
LCPLQVIYSTTLEAELGLQKSMGRCRCQQL